MTELAHVLSAECYAERYALTLRLMLSNIRRKAGMVTTMPGTPRLSGMVGGTLPNYPSGLTNAVGELDGGLQSLLSLPQPSGLGDVGNAGSGEGVNVADWGMDGLEGFAWPNEFSPSNLPVWLQDGVSLDLGHPRCCDFRCIDGLTTEFYRSRPTSGWVRLAVPAPRACQHVSTGWRWRGTAVRPTGQRGRGRRSLVNGVHVRICLSQSM